MKLRLSVSHGGEPPFNFEHAGPVCNLGRDTACELAFPDKSATGVSWRHARIDLGPDGAWVTDLNSSNGTFLDDRRVTERAPLKVGDEIRLGKSGPSLRVVDLVLAPAGRAGRPEPAAVPPGAERGPARAPKPPPAPPPANGRPRGRDPLLLGVLAVLCVTVVALGGLVWWLSGQVRDLGRRTAELEKGSGIDPNDDPALPPAPSARRVELGQVGPAPKGMVDVVLRRQGNDWQRLRAQEAVHGTDVLTALPGYRGELRLKSGVHVLLWGDLDLHQEALPVLESRVVLHEPAGGIDLDLSAERGRLILSNHKEKGEAVVRLRFRDNCWEVQLPDRESEVAVELRGGYLVGAPSRVDGTGDRPITVLNFIARGQAEIKVLRAPEPGRNPDMLTFRLLTQEDADKVWPQLAEWWAGALKEPTADTLAIYTTLREHLDRAPAAVADQLRKTRQARELKPTSQVAAVFGLGAVDDLSGLVAGLEDARPALREAAMIALRQWLGRDGANDRKAFDHLKGQKQFSDARARLAVRWLHGLAEQDQTADTAARLLEGLADPSLVLRQLASWRLAEWQPPPEGKANYDPAADAAQRGRAIQEWKESLPAELKPAS
jgi:pSer/pThr/pTyr-binding forkhead associated (FHA) protein